MTKVAVIGNAGGGKSTLCRRLGQAKRLPHYYVDLIQWQPNWIPTPADDVSRKLADILQEERWIIDGWGDWDSIEKRFSSADTIIMVDMPLYYHYWWSIKRQIKNIFQPREDLPPNCPMLGKSKQLLQTIAYVHKYMRPQLLELLDVYQHDSNTQVYILRSPSELKRFTNAHAS